ncbi:MAG: molecular chaperone HtpG [Spirochaetaceae bacterium]|jgi:molecular chaperone HtpG|nr:molecular chaperone HtpG [Spirochaetaceae bacterium]
MAQHQFQTEVSRLLHLIIHSLYSNREVFLRELVSNASDALDKLKYLTVADEAYKSFSFEPRIDISFNEKDKIIVIRDNGIGMNERDLVESLGTIARSGTKAFLEKLTADAKKDSNLIGQFGVGFYSAFMVADRIEVVSRKAGETGAWKWSSEGKENYDIEPASRDSQGSTVTLYLSAEGAEFAGRWRIDELVKRYSNHVAFPIYLTYEEKEYDSLGKEKSSQTKTDQINAGSALWRRPKSEIKEEDYLEFYKHFGYDPEDPLFYVHTKAEGTQEYITLFYIPKRAPFDLYQSNSKPRVKLYVKRVFITEDDKDLMPSYLRFVRGIIDSEDLPLNVSREILQQNRILSAIKNASVKKLLLEFKNLADNNKEKWEIFISQFNKPLKEGMYQDIGNQELLQDLVRFKSSAVEGWTSFAEYVSRMQSKQKYIYFITGGDEKTLKASPLLEAYTAEGIEVLIMDDEADEIIMPTIQKYKEWHLKGVNKTGADAEISGKQNKDLEKESKPVIEKLKKALGDRVKEVKLSRRLRDSPSCIVADENDLSMQMLQLMKSMGQDLGDAKPILEVNGEHHLVRALKTTEDEQRIGDIAGILLDQALLIEGVKLRDPGEFVKRLNRLIGQGLDA